MTVSAELAGSQVPREVLPHNKIVDGAEEGTEQQQRQEKMAQHRAENSQDLTALLAMQGGEGDDCYAKNSRTQADGVKFVLPTLEAAINRIILPQKPLVKIADLGCSSGPNSIEHMNLVVSLMKSRFAAPSYSGPTPEFQVFFVDLLSNDFNGLFRLINQGRNRQGPLRLQQSMSGVTDYFSTGVFGSFYGRLLPRDSIDVVFSSFSLHWLSKIPEVVQEPHSPAYNDGFVWIHGGKELVAQAYAEQAKRDMCDFLRARAEEMVSGGLMFLLMKGRKDVNPTLQYDPNATTMFGRHMEEVFNELVSAGLLNREVRDSFNIPIYYRTIDEMRDAVQEVSEFDIDRVEMFDDVPGNPVTQAELRASPPECGRRVAKICRSLLGVLVESHMGVAVANEFFLRLEQRAIERSEDEAKEERVSSSHVNLVVLIRK
ncbi:unnamed protein product [Calypogeia fissa]